MLMSFPIIRVTQIKHRAAMAGDFNALIRGKTWIN